MLIIEKTPAETFGNKKITVMGIGKFGGGVGAARFLAENGAHVTVTDLKREQELSESLAELGDLDIRYVLGRHEKESFTEADMVVVNPAVPMSSEYLTLAREARTSLQTEIGLFILFCPAKICGITGSSGKTTTVSMMQKILEHSDKTFWIGGNIGGSLLSSLPRMKPQDWVVLELSSFQLEWLNELKWSPLIAAVLNVTPNHLDRHGTFEHYKRIKSYILDHQQTFDFSVLVFDDPGARSLSDRVRSRLIRVGTDFKRGGIMLRDGWIYKYIGKTKTIMFDTAQLAVPGKHNIINAMTAVACAHAMGIGSDAIAQGLASFRGLPHRIEFVGERNGIRFYNDSKATTPESTVAAVNAFDTKVIPILGGYDKGVSFDSMAHAIAGKIPWAALIGTTADRIGQALEHAGIKSEKFNRLYDALKGCISHAKAGDVILLSPGCASYDMFSDYEQRGEIFKGLVREYLNRK